MSTHTVETNVTDNSVIVADAQKCLGCRKCELACISAHYNVEIKEAAKLRKILPARVHVHKSGTLKMPVQCRQCPDAPCVAVCPTGALLQKNQQGAVILRQEYCSGCSLCSMACPYGAVTINAAPLNEEEKAHLDQEKGESVRMVAVRCDLCQDWRAENGKDVTACMETCPAGVLSKVSIADYYKA